MARIPAYTGNLEGMKRVLSIYDGLNPDEPDERYGLRFYRCKKHSEGQ